MKNIHILPTSKPSRLLYSGNNKNLLFSKEPISFRTFERSPQNIYITNDEEIKEGDWVIKISSLYKGGGIAQKYSFIDAQFEDIIFKKIILTTDQDLINDDVQSIDDEFLEWFVNNPSCEEADVNDWLDDNGNIAFVGDKRYQICNHIYDKIIIPQEELKQIKCYCGHTITCDCEPKQETLEESAEKYAEIYRCPATNYNEYCRHDIISAINFGAKWQQERMYSEEDMIEFAEFVATYPDKNKNINGQILHAKSKYDGSERTVDLLEQFKNK